MVTYAVCSEYFLEDFLRTTTSFSFVITAAVDMVDLQSAYICKSASSTFPTKKIKDLTLPVQIPYCVLLNALGFILLIPFPVVVTQKFRIFP